MIKPSQREVLYVVSLIAGVAAGGAAFVLKRDIALSTGAIVLFGTYLGFVLTGMPQMTPDFLRRNARQADLPVTVMFVVVLAVVAAAIVSLFQLINGQHDPDPLQLGLALVTVALSWCTIHTMYAIHYAHVCWLDDDATDAREDETPREKAHGLEFPGDDQPGGLDFLYFSGVIGLTAQTADVDTTTTRLRRIVLTHSILAYIFNTVIVAAAVNAAVSLGH